MFPTFLPFYARFADVVVLPRETNRDSSTHENLSLHSLKTHFSPKGKPVEIEMFAHLLFVWPFQGSVISAYTSWDEVQNRGACGQVCSTLSL